MSWETISPKRGARPENGGIVVSWKQNGGKASKRWVLQVVITTDLAEQMGWKPGDRVLVERDRQAGLMRLSVPKEPSDTFVLQKMAGSKSLFTKLQLRDVEGAPGGNRARGAQLAKHCVVKGAIEITLPSWAAPGRAGTDLARIAAEDAKAKLSKAA